jgi:hypothetical protein
MASALNHRLAAEVVARMLDTAERVRTEVATENVGWLSLFPADAHLLGGVIGAGCSREDQEAIRDRLRPDGAQR